MKFTLSWLKDYLDTEASVDEIGAKLTSLGLEIEDIDNPAETFAPFKVAYVESAEKHPDADRLKVCKVQTADHGVVQVVCGAPNARAGMKAVFAPAGSYIPGLDVTLQKGVIRGVESNGMLVSEKEMMLSDEHKGIIDLPEDTEVGTPMAELFGLNDPVFEIGLTPNRPDCAGVLGIARDLAAAGLGRFKGADVPQIESVFDNPVNVNLAFEGNNEPCPVFMGRYVRGVKNGPSPKWLQQRLKAIGLRPISALVDITNYMSIALCRPLHVFDADKLKGDISVRLSKGGETLNGLNDKSYTLEEGMTAVCDDSGVVGLGGVLGGEETGCTDETVNVYIECAYFDPIRTAVTGRKLGIISDARYRFERGVDPEFVASGMEIATQMVMDLCGGEPSTVYTAGDAPSITQTIEFNIAKTKQLTGVDVPEAQQIEILEALGFGCSKKSDGVYDVTTPSWRPDIQGAADFVEEVIRVYGFDKLEPLTLPKETAISVSAETHKTWLMRKSRHALAARGVQECVTWSFMDKELAGAFGANDNQGEGLTLLNAISEDLAHMRPSILPNLIAAAGRNAARGFAGAALFEIGPIFFAQDPEKQPLCASAIRTESIGGKSWHSAETSRAVDVFDAKADAMAVLDACGMNAANVQVKTEGTPGWFHPGRSGVFQLGKNVIGYFGEFHPAVLEEMDIETRVVGFELFLENIPVKKKKSAHIPLLKLNPLMPLSRDFAFIADEATEAQAILHAAKGADKKLITEAEIFDVYQGKGVEDGKKSIAVSITIQPQDKTLTDEDIEALSQKVINNVAKYTQAVLRA